jgi:hypothetical protein
MPRGPGAALVRGRTHGGGLSATIPDANHFVPLLGSECSTVEPPPFFVRDERELRRCATGAVAMAEREQDMTAMQLTVDGQRVADLAAYRAVTPRFTLWFPEHNLMGSASRVADSVADGYQVLLRPLPVGEHLVEITIPAPQGEVPTVVSYRLWVESGAYAAATASTVASPSS